MDNQQDPTPNANPDIWQVPGALGQQIPLAPETPPDGQWAAIEARMQRKHRRPLLWFFVFTLLVAGAGVAAWFGAAPGAQEHAVAQGAGKGQKRTEVEILNTAPESTLKAQRPANALAKRPNIGQVQPTDQDQASGLADGAQGPSTQPVSGSAPAKNRQTIRSNNHQIERQIPVKINKNRVVIQASEGENKGLKSQESNLIKTSITNKPVPLSENEKVHAKRPNSYHSRKLKRNSDTRNRLPNNIAKALEGEPKIVAGTYPLEHEDDKNLANKPMENQQKVKDIGSLSKQENNGLEKENTPAPSPKPQGNQQGPDAPPATPAGAQEDLAAMVQKGPLADSVPKSHMSHQTADDSAAPNKDVVPTAASIRHLPLFFGIKALSTVASINLPAPSAGAGTRLTSLGTGYGLEIAGGYSIERLAKALPALSVDFGLHTAFIKQAYTFVLPAMGKPVYTYQTQGDSLVALPVAQEAQTKTKQIWQVGFVPTLCYKLGQKGAALQAGLGLWGIWQAGAGADKPSIQLQPELGLSYPLFLGVDMHVSARYQASSTAQWSTLSGKEQRMYYGFGLVWRP